MKRYLVAVAVALAPCIASAQSVETLQSPVVNNKGGEIGRITARGGAAGVVIRVELRAGALTPGWHGAHLHAVGDCSDTSGFQNSKGHVNHDQKKHGLMNGEGPDMGDLPNLYAAADGSVNAEVFTPFVRMTGERGIKDADGSAFVIHASEDDHATQPIGNAGARVACAVMK
jgi:Cu-Zn family superoxide dismutase